MVDRLFFSAKLTGRRGSHTQLVQTGVETPDTGAVAVEPDPGSSWEVRSGRMDADVGDENAEPCGTVHPLCVPLVSAQCAARMLLLLSDKLMSCCAAGTNGCLDLRRRAFSLDGQVSAEWSKCPSSMARRARDSVTPWRLSSADWMPARIGRLSTGAGRRHPDQSRCARRC